MDKRTEIHTEITKEEAYNLMLKGYRIAHQYYTSDEYLYMIGKVIYDENGYVMGSCVGKFWQKIQKWETGWRTFNGA